MRDLLENVFNENFVAAQNVFESRMQEIMEKKLHEMKKDLQAEGVGGGLTKAEIEARKKAGYRKASEVLGDPRGEEKVSAATQRLRKAAKKKINEMRAPGEVPGSDERKMDAMRLRALRTALGPDKSELTKPYLAARKAQMAPKDTPSSDKPKKPKQGPYLRKVDAERRQATQQKRVDTVTGQSVKNLLKMKNFRKNLGRVVKYGAQSTQGKVAGIAGSSLASGFKKTFGGIEP